MPYSYRALRRTLQEAGIEDASDEAALLLEHFCGVNRTSCLIDPDRAYDGEELSAAVARRSAHYPLQYILGTWHFYGCTFHVNEHCLIPRPDTECLVEEAVRVLPPGAFVADLCTGSGCIAIALLKARPDVRAVALELYPDTLALAVKNAEENGVADRMIPISADLLSDGASALAALAPFDAILSNPPYIPTETVNGLAPELSHEPRAALDGGADGLTFYRAILTDYPSLLKPGGRMLLEIGYDQAEHIVGLARTYLPAAAGSASVKKDLGGRDRVFSLTMTAAAAAATASAATDATPAAAASSVDILFDGGDVI